MSQQPNQQPTMTKKIRIGEVLLEEGLLTPQQLEKALA